MGRQEFYGRYFMVNPDVLIPRHKTEFIIESVMELKPIPGSSIIDVGAGSRCIGIILALELPKCHVMVTDISHAALKTARTNAIQLGAHISISCMDLLDAAVGPFDLVVSNSPYISPREFSNLQIEVRGA